jgi:hypothetical protein
MKRALVASVLALAGSYVVSARAQEAAQPSFFQKTMPAPSTALELNLSSAYNQGWGNLTDPQSIAAETIGRRFQDFAGAGVQFEVDLGLRISPMFGVGAYTTLTGYTNQTEVSGTNVRSLTAGIQGQWFIRPYRAFCPWIALGSAYRGVWVIPEFVGMTSRQGWQIARLQVGTDFRLSNDIAVAPYLAGDINVIFGEKLPLGEYRNLSGPPAFATFTAGILGRFDMFGRYHTQAGTVARQ